MSCSRSRRKVSDSSSMITAWNRRTGREPIKLLIVLSSDSVTSPRGQSSADFIINTAGCSSRQRQGCDPVLVPLDAALSETKFDLTALGAAGRARSLKCRNPDIAARQATQRCHLEVRGPDSSARRAVNRLRIVSAETAHTATGKESP